MTDPNIQWGRSAAAWLGLGLLVLGCAPEKGPSAEPEPTQPQAVGTLHAVTLGFGPAWDPKAGLVLLDPHNAEIELRYDAGALVANALLGDGRGPYLYDGDAVDPDALAASDPAIGAGLLVVDAAEDWVLFLENMGVELGEGDATFILDYSYGPSADPDLPFVEQDLAAHSAYFGGLFGEDRVLAGGVIGQDRARYIVVADDLGAAEALAAADPAVTDETFEVATVPWGNPEPFPTYFHRRSLEDTQAAQQ